MVYTVVITDDRFGNSDEERAVLREAEDIDINLEVLSLKDEKQTIEALRDVDAVLVNLHPLPGTVIRKLNNCRIISRYGVGYDNVDVEAATRAGIWVARVPDYSFEDVSDQALALLFGCVRKITHKDRRIRSGGWNLHNEQPCYRIKGKTLGLIGFGAIARTLHRKVSGFGLNRVLTYDPYLKPEQIRDVGAQPVELAVLLKESDYISIHAPLTDETQGLIDEKSLSLCKPRAILINTSRGPLVDEEALCRALEQGRLAGAGLDVFAEEPLPESSPLRGRDDVILSDHTGYYSEESMIELKTKAARNVLAVLTGGKPIYPVNQV